MLPPPTGMRQSGRPLGNARGSGEKTSWMVWSSTRPMPMVASSGAMRDRPCNGRVPSRSMAMPSSAQTAITTSAVNGNGRRSRTAQTQPT